MSSSKSSSGKGKGKGKATYQSPYPPVTSAPYSAVPQLVYPTDDNSSSSYSSPMAAPSIDGHYIAQSSMTKEQKKTWIKALDEHRLNNIKDLRRVERMFIADGSPELTQPLSAAWMFYVNSHNLLDDLRNLTKDWPFSSVMLDDAKLRVLSDPLSARSWNYCWLVLTKMLTDEMILPFAQAQAVQPEMWADHEPTMEEMIRLTQVFVEEWTTAIGLMLRYWDAPPIVAGWLP